MTHNIAKTGIASALAALALAAGQGCSGPQASPAPEMPWDSQAMSTYIFMDKGHGVDSAFISKVDFDNFDNVYLINYESWKSQEDFDSSIDSILASGGAAFPLLNAGVLKFAIDEAHRAGTKAMPSLISDVQYGACDSVRRAKLVKAIVQMVDYYDADGIDIDWEGNLYPNLDKHTALMEELRAALDSLGATNGREYLLSTALSIECRYYPEELRERMGKAVDMVNMMAYDTGGGIWADSATHNTPLKLYADSIDRNWKNVPREKLHLGLASYGFIYNNLLPGERVPEGSSTEDFGRYISYNEMTPMIYNNREWRAEYDSTQCVYYFINDNTRSFITADTPETLMLKYQLAADKGLGGTFWWEYSKDIVPDKDGGSKWMHTLIPPHKRKESYKSN